MKYLFPFVYLSAAALMYWNMNTLEMVLVGLLDSGNESAMPAFAYFGLALGLSVAQLKAGDAIFQSAPEVNNYTGKVTRPRSFYIAIFFVLFMLLFIFLVSSLAVQNSAVSLGSLPYISVTISAIEVLLGGLFLEKACAYTHLALLGLLMRFDAMKMRKAARQTHESYTIYRNMEENVPGSQPKGSKDIQAALVYYNENEGVADDSTVRLIIDESHKEKESLAEPDDTQNQTRQASTNRHPIPENPDAIERDLNSLNEEQQADNQEPIYNTNPQNNLTL